jgi:hypothetical protein
MTELRFFLLDPNATALFTGAAGAETNGPAHPEAASGRFGIHPACDGGFDGINVLIGPRPRIHARPN